MALTIDTVEFPPHVLLVRGNSALDWVPGVPAEYLEAARKQVSAEGMPAFEAQVSRADGAARREAAVRARG